MSHEPNRSVSDSAAREHDGDRDRRVVGVSNYTVTTDEAVLVAYGLGTCVAIGLSDPANGVYALAHTVLPREPSDSTASPGRYADTTVQAMLRDMVDRGAGYGSVTGWLVGGATVFPVADLGLPENIGTEAAAAAREQLSGLDVPVVAEAVGGDHGRTVEFDTGSGEVLCRRADREPRRLDVNGRNRRDN